MVFLYLDSIAIDYYGYIYQSFQFITTGSPCRKIARNSGCRRTRSRIGYTQIFNSSRSRRIRKRICRVQANPLLSIFKSQLRIKLFRDRIYYNQLALTPITSSPIDFTIERAPTTRLRIFREKTCTHYFLPLYGRLFIKLIYIAIIIDYIHLPFSIDTHSPIRIFHWSDNCKIQCLEVQFTQRISLPGLIIIN